MFGKKKKHPFDAGVPENEYLATYQATKLEKLEKKVDKLITENEYLRARLHELDNEDRELMRRSLRAQINKDESPFGQDILGESRE